MSLGDPVQAYMDKQIRRVRAAPPKRIAFPEGNDPRVLEAAGRLAREGLVEPVLIAHKPAGGLGGVTYIDPAHSARRREYEAIYFERRRARGITEMEAAEIVRRPLYFAALMTAAGDADGFVGGAANTTAETVRAALHAIGTPPKVRTVSSVFLMALRNHHFGAHGMLAFADCAIVIDPNSVQLADIAMATALSTRALLGVEPLIALLSYSTKGSGSGAGVAKVVEARRIVEARAPELRIDGELQADAALVAAVAQSKAPGSSVAGCANTLIFPDLDSGNIGYKLVERLAGATAIGPFLQGLRKPANDLSRGCSAEDVYNVAVITALQAEAARSQGAA